MRGDVSELEPESLRLEISRLSEQPRALQRAILRSALQDLCGGLQEFSLAHVDALLDLTRRTEGSGRLDLPNGICARREYEALVLGPAPGEGSPPAPEPSPPLDLTRSGEIRWGRTRLRWSLAEARERDPESWAGTGGNRSCFDPAGQLPPLYLRGVRVGDRLEPSGMDGSQKLSDLLINRKVPRHLRTWVPVLCDNGGPETGERILWVVGQRRSRHAPVESSTAQVVYFEAEPIV
jgi:tRNA(Ile)-lysidine synthetase-like protein